MSASESTPYGFAHDPLCPVETQAKEMPLSAGGCDCDDCRCCCDLIAAVRADERGKVLTQGLLYAARFAAAQVGER